MAWIGQKDEQQDQRSEASKATPPSPSWKSDSAQGGATSARSASIGKTLKITGEISGTEDLTVWGKVEGSIMLKDNNVTVGNSGSVTAEIHGKVVSVSGEVHGNIHASDKVEITNSGTMRGDVHAPRVVLADGANFKGSIDMSAGKSAAAKPAERQTAPQQSTPSSVKDIHKAG